MILSCGSESLKGDQNYNLSQQKHIPVKEYVYTYYVLHYSVYTTRTFRYPLNELAFALLSRTYLEASSVIQL